MIYAGQPTRRMTADGSLRIGFDADGKAASEWHGSPAEVPIPEVIGAIVLQRLRAILDEVAFMHLWLETARRQGEGEEQPSGRIIVPSTQVRLPADLGRR